MNWVQFALQWLYVLPGIIWFGYCSRWCSSSSPLSRAALS
jgi:uncharacterized membrane protein